MSDIRRLKEPLSRSAEAICAELSLALVGSGLWGQPHGANHGCCTAKVSQSQFQMVLVANGHDEAQVNRVKGDLVVHVDMGDV